MIILRTCSRGQVRNSVKSFFNSRYSHGGIVQQAFNLSPSIKYGYNPWATSNYRICAKKIQNELHDKIVLKAKRFLIKSTICDAHSFRAAVAQKSYPTLIRKTEDVDCCRTSTSQTANLTRSKRMNSHQLRHQLKLSITNFRSFRAGHENNLKLSVLHNIKGLYTKLQDKYSNVTINNAINSRHFHAMSLCIRNVRDRRKEKVQSLKGELSSLEFFNERDESILTLMKHLQKGRTYSTESNPEDSKAATTSSETQTESHGSYAKIRKAMKEYGYTVFVFYFTISTISLWSFYFAITSGLDVVGLLTKLGVGDSFIQWLKTKLASKSSSFAVNFVIAYAVHKVFLPLRIGMTLTCSPLIVRYLRKIGFIKPVQKGSSIGKKT